MKTRLTIFLLFMAICCHAQSGLIVPIDSFEIDITQKSTDTTLIIHKSLVNDPIHIKTNKVKGQGKITLSSKNIALPRKQLFNDVDFTVKNTLNSITLTYSDIDPAPALKTIYFATHNEVNQNANLKNESINNPDKTSITPELPKEPTDEELVQDYKNLLLTFYGLLAALILSLGILAFTFYRNYRNKRGMFRRNKVKDEKEKENHSNEIQILDDDSLFTQLKNRYEMLFGENQFSFETLEQAFNFLRIPELSKKTDKKSTESMLDTLDAYKIDLTGKEFQDSSEPKLDPLLVNLMNYKEGEDLEKIIKPINQNAANIINQLSKESSELKSIEQKFNKGKKGRKAFEKYLKTIFLVEDLDSLESLSTFIKTHSNEDLFAAYNNVLLKARHVDEELSYLKTRMNNANSDADQFSILDDFISKFTNDYKEVIDHRNNVIDQRKKYLEDLTFTENYVSKHFEKEEHLSYRDNFKAVFDYLIESHKSYMFFKNESEFLSSSTKYFNALKNEIELKIQSNMTELGRSLMAKYITEMAFHFKDFLSRMSKDDEGKLNKELMEQASGNIKNFDSNKYEVYTHNSSKFSNFIINLKVLLSDMNPTDLDGALFENIYFEEVA